MDPITLATTIGTIGAGVYNTMSQKSANDYNTAATERMNALNLKYQEMNNLRNREWALSDWDKVNAYNSPTQQMQRLREAGLNPNLVYGKGADNTAMMVSRTEGRSPEQAAPHKVPVQIPESLPGDLFASIMLRPQVEKLRAETALLNKQSQVQDVNMASTAMTTAKTQFDLQQAKALMDTTIEGAKLHNMKTKADTEFTTMSKELRPKEFELTKAKTTQEIANMQAELVLKQFESANVQPATLSKIKAEIQNLLKEGNVKTLEAELAKTGLVKSDPWYARAIHQWLMRQVDSVPVKTNDPAFEKKMRELREKGVIAPYSGYRYKW